jgi:hypothetical protein
MFHWHIGTPQKMLNSHDSFHPAKILSISEINSADTTSQEGLTYTLNCNGAEGDMLYLTDLDYSDPYGHNLAEVKIYGIGMKVWISKQNLCEHSN